MFHLTFWNQDNDSSSYGVLSFGHCMLLGNLISRRFPLQPSDSLYTMPHFWNGLLVSMRGRRLVHLLLSMGFSMSINSLQAKYESPSKTMGKDLDLGGAHRLHGSKLFWFWEIMCSNCSHPSLTLVNLAQGFYRRNGIHGNPDQVTIKASQGLCRVCRSLADHTSIEAWTVPN